MLDYLPTSAPQEPREEVRTLIENMNFSQDDVSTIFHIYQQLRRKDGSLRTKTKLITLRTSSVINIVNDHRIYVLSLLRNIMQMGGCYEYIDWNHFLYIFIRFCSLTKVELCQLMFLIIIRESRGLDVHYMTATQLDIYYEIFRVGRSPLPPGTPPPPESMTCNKVHFSNFPLSRYYVTDFVEICFLYNQLINPLLFLQRQFQRIFPSLRFWDNYENKSLIGNRKITIDFFLMKRSRVYIASEDPFKETCDLLLLSSELIHSKIFCNRGIIPAQDDTSAWSNLLKKLGSGGNPIEDDGKTKRNNEIEFLGKNHRLSHPPDTQGMYKLTKQQDMILRN